MRYLTILLPRERESRIWGALVAVALAVLTIAFNSTVLADPNGHVFTGEGDGLKNYFTFAWQVKHSPGFMDCSGVNYPYGELVFYTDGHPALSWLLQLLPFTAPYAVGILNVLLLAGQVVYGVFVFGLLRRFGLPGWAAAAGAFGLTLLQPQIFRLSGHLALAHCWLLPLAWYLSLRARTSARPWRASLVAASVLLFAFLTHPYLGLMLAIFLLSTALLFALRDGYWRGSLPGFAQAVLPLVGFVVLLKVVDHHTGRYGIPVTGEDNLASMAGLCEPHTASPIAFITDLWTGRQPASWESWCYLGAGTLLMLLIAAGVQLVHWSRRNGPLAERPRDPLTTYLGAAFVVLFFALGFHKPFEAWFPLLKQFRGIARFAWIFYLVAGVFAVVRAYQYLVLGRDHGRVWRVALFLLIPGLFVVEGWPQQLQVGGYIASTSNPFHAAAQQGALADLIDAAERSGAAALMPVPFDHSGSEVHIRNGSQRVFSSLFPLSYHTGLPLLCGVTSRTSIDETLKQFSLIAPLEFPKSITPDLHMGDTILIVWTGEPLEEEEAALVSRCMPYFQNKQAHLLTITTDELVRNTAAQVLQPYLDGRVNKRPWHDQFLQISEEDSTRNSAVLAMSGPDAHERIWRVNERNVLFDYAPGVLDTASDYELSFTFREVDPGSINIPIIWETVDPDKRDGRWDRLKNLRSMPMVLNNRIYATMRFRPERGRKNSLFIMGNERRRERYAIDHVVLRKIGAHVWREEQAPGGTLILRDNVPLNPSVLNGTAAPGS